MAKKILDVFMDILLLESLMVNGAIMLSVFTSSSYSLTRKLVFWGLVCGPVVFLIKFVLR